MKNIEIEIKNNYETRIYGTDDNTISIPAGVDFESEDDTLELFVKDLEKTKIGILPKSQGKLEISSTNKEDIPRSIYLENLSYQKIELDLSGMHRIYVNDVECDIDLNAIDSTITVYLSNASLFKYEEAGVKNAVTSVCTGDTYIIEVNGKSNVVCINEEE